ncbi:MAG: hypothetical protein R2873_15040 [Caldilineaceae bacterium]
MIKETHGIEWRLDNIPFEGEEAVGSPGRFSSGEVSGVFQVESCGERRVLTDEALGSFEAHTRRQ